MEILIIQYFITFGWALTGAISMAVALGLLTKIFDWISPINEWEELKQGNMAVAIVFAAIIIGTAFVIGLTLMP